MEHDEIEAQREFNEALVYEDYIDTIRGRKTKWCPACGFPMYDDQIVCDECFLED